jgi:hypothetical protein
VEESAPPGRLVALGRDPGGLVACDHCGWEGPEAAVGTGGMGPFDGLAAGCPRCGSTVAHEMPTIEEVQAARRGRDI